jgi:hypothetical protein
LLQLFQIGAHQDQGFVGWPLLEVPDACSGWGLDRQSRQGVRWQKNGLIPFEADKEILNRQNVHGWRALAKRLLPSRSR